MKKLLIFGPANSPHLLNWALPFLNEFNVEIVTFHAPSENLDYCGASINVISAISGTKLDYFLQTSQVQKMIDTFRPDIIHAHYASSYGYICSKLKGDFLRVLTVWGSDVNHARKNLIHRYFIDSALKKFDWVNVPSEDLKKILLGIGIRPEKILVFQYGTDLDFCKKFKTKRNISEEINIFSSRLWAPLYNIDKIVEAFKVSFEKNSNLRLILSGNGTFKDNEKIMRLVDRHPAIKPVGFISKEELVKYLWEADIYISIPDSDGMSLSVLEALYCECFPILSDIPPNREILNYCKGLVLTDNSREKLSEIILEAASKCRTTDLTSNVQFIDSRANYQKNMEKIKRIYNSEHLA